MRTRISFRAVIILLMFASQSLNANPGRLFNILATGSPSVVSITLCLNGQGALSCQNETVSALNLMISPTISNHLYPSIGIRINTPGYTLANLGVDCIPYANGYCLFSASQLQPKSLTLVAGSLLDQATLIANATPSAISYGGTSTLSTTGGSGSGAVTYTLTSGASNCSISGTTLTGIAAGSCTLTATKAADTIYNSTTSAPIGVTVTVTRFVSVGALGGPFPLSYTTLDGGVNWSASTGQPSGSGTLYSVACSGVGLNCVAVGDDGAGSLLSYTTTNGGVTWVASTPQPVGSGILYSVACSSSGLNCTTVGTDGSAPIGYTTINRGVTWAVSTTQPPGTGTLNSVACSASGSNCTAVGNDGVSSPLSYTTTDGGGTWVASTPQPPGSGTLNSVACSDSGLICTAVGNYASVPLSYKSTNRGNTWVPSTTLPPVGSILNSVTCSNDGLRCIAVGMDDSNGVPLSYITANGGDTWVASTTQPPVNDSNNGNLYGVTCANNELMCTAVGNDGNSQPLSYTTTNKGVTWVLSVTQPPITGPGNLKAVG